MDFKCNVVMNHSILICCNKLNKSLFLDQLSRNVNYACWYQCCFNAVSCSCNIYHQYVCIRIETTVLYCNLAIAVKTEDNTILALYMQIFYK